MHRVEAAFADAIKPSAPPSGIVECANEDHIFRIATADGPATTMALVAETESIGLAIQSLAVKSTTLDDVFVHYTGRDLRDALQDPAPRQFPGFRR